MSLRYALLGFLTTEPASGYQIAQEFSDSMGWFWYASHSQIHPELRRLEADGLVTSVVPGSSPSPRPGRRPCGSGWPSRPTTRRCATRSGSS